MQHHNDTTIKTHEETTGRLLFKYSPLTLLQGLHVRGCWRLNINFIFWPHCYDRHVVSFLFSWCSTRGLGVHSIRAFRVPLGRVWPSLPHLVSRCLDLSWQLHRGFPRSPSVGCGLPYHISSLTLWESAGNCPGGFPRTPSVGCGLPTTSGLYCLEFFWQLLWDPNSTELNNNSTPTRSPTGSLKSNVQLSSSGNNCHAVQRLLSSGAWL